MVKFLKPLAIVGAVLAIQPVIETRAQSVEDKRAVIATYAEIGQAAYQDSLTGARALMRAVEALTAKPSEATLAAARKAWLAARVPYPQTEVFRFGNPVVDDWEGRVNAWPLDEGLIDYVDASYGTDAGENPLYTANVIANAKIIHGGKTVDAARITWRTLRSLQEFGGVEANVASGYHAIEFLLWGQDLNGTGPGRRQPAVDRLCARRGLHQRSLRPSRAVSQGRHSDAGRRSRLDGQAVGRRRRGAQGGGRRRAGCRARGHPHRHRQPVLWRVGGRAHEARPHAARSGGGA